MSCNNDAVKALTGEPMKMKIIQHHMDIAATDTIYEVMTDGGREHEKTDPLDEFDDELIEIFRRRDKMKR